MGKVAGVFVGLSVAVLAAGVGLALGGGSQDDPNIPNDVEERTEKEVGKDLAKWGGIGLLGSVAVFSVPLALTAKKKSSYLKKELINRHNDALENGDGKGGFSMHLGVGWKSVNSRYAPAVFWTVKF